MTARAPADRPGSHDRIFLADHVRAVEIGAFQEERGVTQRLRFNVSVELRQAGGPVSDDVDRILSYDTILEAIEDTLAEERFSLLETLAERIAARLLRAPRARRVTVRIEKLDRGPFALGVEIAREAAGAQAPAAEPAPDAALVLHLSNAAIADARLPSWLDQIADEAGPTVLTVGFGPAPVPKTGAPLTQRRVDLLALEQNAWALAARDRRCLVVESRTEIAHALREGRMVVWAPAKIVLDAADEPAPAVRDPAALAAWLAGRIGARRLSGLGVAVPGGGQLALADRLDL